MAIQTLDSKKLLEYLLKITLRIRSKFYDLSISHKLNLGFGVLVGLTFLVVSRNYLGSLKATKNIKRTQNIRVPTVITSAQAEANLLRMSSHVRGYLATGESDFRDRYQQARQEFETELVEMEKLLQVYSSPNNKQHLQELQIQYQEWKVIPDQLFALRDNYYVNQPALQLLKDQGETPINLILAHITAIIDDQGTRPPSSVNTILLKEMASFQSSFALLVSALRGYLLTQESSFRFEYAAKFQANQEAWEKLQSKYNLLTNKQKKSFDKISLNHQVFLELPHEMFEIVEGEKHRQDLFIFRTKAEPLAENMLVLLQEIVASQQESLTRELQAGTNSLVNAQWDNFLGVLLALLLAIFMTILLREKIAGPISRLTRATNQIIEGDFDAKAIIESGDEIGILATTFNQMTDHLKQSHQELENYSHILEERTFALAEAKEAAEIANHTKSSFLANISHELRTPLNVILGFTQIMSRDITLSEKQQETLRIINHSGEHLLLLINDVLEVTKIESGKTSLYHNDIDLHSLLDSLEEMLKLKAEEKGLNMFFVQDQNLPRYIRSDESKLRQILINLLSNAIKFTTVGTVKLQAKVLDLETAKSADDNANLTSLLFEVSDTGMGIAETELKSLFEPFVQTASGIKSQQGTGLGLAISRKFAQLMGGNISVISELGQGSTFRVTLTVQSVVQATVNLRETRRVIGLAKNQHRYRILIIEDRWENRLLLSNLLEPLNLEVREAENGQQGVAIWQEWQPHLIFMDMQMPIMNGIEATKYIRAQAQKTNTETAIIALTANVFTKQRSEILAAGCDDYITKPFKEAIIFEKMAQHLPLTYLYEEEISSQSNASAISEKLTSENLAIMPNQWRTQLNEAALQLNSELLEKLITEIPDEHQSLMLSLKNKIENFDFDHILELL
ncbi:signal transduction histidine kinase [Xenococcus sp. PCC 7305]|uniref:ATP-binding protein n=1 Tax=Xenococcus sp. PCC 7305 TaxID=102125 RepID=UPI0002AC6FD1|nr:ATP-binding protein [Xenococcus sp. PCC 7305]ELS03160.1 signal transduction histidine kinase [Xenococcus sp. PCC 7305]